MKDKKLEKKIKLLKEFMELWIKFHDLYKSALSKQSISADDEKNFLETKSLIARKYQMLKEFLALEPSSDDKTFDVIGQVLSLEGVSTISDLAMKKIESDWHNSYIQLNRMLGEIESKTEELKLVSTLGILLKKIFINPIVNLILLIIFIIAIYYAVMYYMQEYNPSVIKADIEKIKFEPAKK